MNKKSIKLLSLFSGIGSPEQALKNIGVDYELVGFSEVDKFAIKSYCKVHDVSEDLSLGDITKIDISSLPTDIDLITHGSPCFVAGTKVLTEEGYKNIEDVIIGDKVITHTNEYKEVYEVMENESNDIYTIKTRNSFEIKATGNHPFYVREKIRKWDNKNRKYVTTFGNAEWKWLRELDKNYYVGVAINNKSELPNWEGVEDNRKGHKDNINNLKDKFTDNRFWYFVGRYLGDGWTTVGYNKKENKPTYRVTICCNKKLLRDLESKIENLFNYTIIEDRTTYKLQFANKELALYLERFEKGAANKRLIKDVLNLPIDLLKSFIEGYIESDGCCINGTYKISSVSKELILGISECIAKVYKVPYSIYKTKRPQKHIIEGRTVNQKDSYTVTFKLEGYKEGFLEDDLLWMPIREVEKDESLKTKVYNLEVKDNHSYTVNNIIVHNCQDFSIAGQQKGGDKGTGTRSSLMWTTVDMVEHCRPKVVLWENVKNLLSKKHRHNFGGYLEVMEELGYNNYYQVLNAKNYGIPQNRERVFTVSIRKDIDKGYVFPEPQELTLRLKDMLEDEVDEKYYISTCKVQQLLKNIDGKLDLNKQVIGTCHKRNDLSRSTRDIVYNAEKNAPTLNATMYKDPIKVLIPIDGKNSKMDNVTMVNDNYGMINGGTIGKMHDSSRRCYSVDYVSPTINTCGGGNLEPKIIEPTNANGEMVFKVRKLTPRECWRLMGFTDEQFDKAAEICSNTQLYKQAGNSIVVNVLEEIFKNMTVII